jgi:hypothetical protein
MLDLRQKTTEVLRLLALCVAVPAIDHPIRNWRKPDPWIDSNLITLEETHASLWICPAAVEPP